MIMPVAVFGPLFVTVTVYVKGSPGSNTGSGESVLVIDKSASVTSGGLTIVPAVLLLLAVDGFGSVSAAVTDDVLLIVPLVGLAKIEITMSVAVLPDVRLARLQDTTNELWPQVQPVPMTLTNVTPGGR